MDNWTNPKKVRFEINAEEVYTVYCKLKEVNEENIEFLQHTTSTFSNYKNIPTFGYFHFGASLPQIRCDPVVHK